nr:ribosomal protein S subunit 19 [Haplopteris ensiformis]UQV94647.1 ribosomal protein S subunit 19 [Haplopteris ensiformis]
VWKGPFVDACFLRRTKKIRGRIWSRRSSILPKFKGCYAEIHNGRSFIRLRVTNEKVGHKFGEFASTRKASRTTKIKPK